MFDLTGPELGHNVSIHNSAVIGYEGFGFAKDTDGNFIYPLKRNVHKYSAIIEKDVEIGPLCVIDRGSWRDTVIGEGTKIDSGCKIAHNVQIGKDCIICPNVTILGSVTIGSKCFIGGGAVIKDHITIGNNVVIGCAANVVHDVPNNTTVKGNPAK